MADNSQQILNDVLAQQREDHAPASSDEDYFEIFCAEQILKDFDLSYDEVQAGIVDGEHDGGIDSVYAFVNGELIYEDFDSSPFKRDVLIELHIIQSKTSGGFSEALINQLISVTNHLLKLDENYDQLSQYNPGVKAALDNFRQTYRKLASKFPSLKLCYYYACKRADTAIHTNLQRKAEELKEVAHGLFADAEITVNFLGARQLLSLARKHPKTTHELRVSKNLSDFNGYVVLCPLGEYVQFLKNSDGKVRGELFESNVRDFQGGTEVNAEIVKTLQEEKIVDFWWMNNGVTILASRATLNGDTVTIENPQIVNGLQTSTQIARHFASNSEDRRSVMVKIISSEDDETRDKIIKATNSQNGVQPATLRATDKVQRDIEETLKAAGLFYDRRKNFYKNEGKPADKIISIPLMAQAVMTIILGLPDSARARPSSLIKEDAVYSKVFSERYPIELYTKSASLIQRVNEVLRNRSGMTVRNRANIRFYVLFWVTAMLAKSPSPNAAEVARIDVSTVADRDIEAAIDEVCKLYEGLGESDQVAKSSELRNATIEEIKTRLHQKIPDRLAAEHVNDEGGPSGHQEENVRFWTAVFDGYAFSDVTVEVPKGRKGPWLSIKVRHSGSSDSGLSFVSFLERSTSTVGCFLTCRKGNQPGADVYEEVGRSLDELRRELGDDLEHWERDGRPRIGFRRPTQLPFTPEGNTTGEFVDAVAWMRDRLDRLVSTIHPRLQLLISARN